MKLAPPAGSSIDYPTSPPYTTSMLAKGKDFGKDNDSKTYATHRYYVEKVTTIAIFINTDLS